MIYDGKHPKDILLNLLQPLQIATFDDATANLITVMMQQQHSRLAQLDRPYSTRSLTTRNYDSAIKALGDYLARNDTSLPIKSLLAQWRDDMLVGSADETVAQLNEQAFKQMEHCDREFKVIPGATHLFEEPGALDQVAELAAQWFMDHMKERRDF